MENEKVLVTSVYYSDGRRVDYYMDGDKVCMIQGVTGQHILFSPLLETYIDYSDN